MLCPSETYSKFVRPFAGELMRMLRLDWRFGAARGDWLVGCEGAEASREVLDMLGGFGSTILGHSNAEAVAIARDYLERGRPIHAQLSCRFETAAASALLSSKLETVFGEPSVCHWVNSGSEAVDVALKHALLGFREEAEDFLSAQAGVADRLRAGLARWEPASARGLTLDAILELQAELLARPRAVLSLRHSYHGRTLGALNASDSPLRDRLGGKTAGEDPRAIFLDADRPESWEAAVAPLLTEWPLLFTRGESAGVRWVPRSTVIAILVEPVQGEGGIHPLSADATHALGELRARLGAPIIADEIQSGMGRCGAFVASTVIGLRPDVVLLGKGLGGGIAKVGVVAIRAGAYRKDLGRFGATFSEDGLGAELARWAIEKTSDDFFLERVRAVGEALRWKLELLRADFPDVVRDVRGVGLLMGVELVSLNGNCSNLLRLFSRNGLTGYLAASFLLNRHRVRIAPSLSAPDVLRMEPSGYIDPASVDLLIDGLRDFCVHLRHGDFAAITRHLWDPEGKIPLTGSRDFRGHDRVSRMDEGAVDVKVAFLGHLLDLRDLALFDASLNGIPVETLATWYRQGEGFFRPALFDRVHLRAPSGKKIEVNLIGVYETPELMVKAHRSRAPEEVLRRIQQAVDDARAMGCTVVGLGGLTSVLSRNGVLLESRGMCLTTGNGLTLAMSCQALENLAERRGLALANCTIAIVGAAGNIGKAYAEWGAGRAGRLILLGRAGRTREIEELARRLRAERPGLDIVVDSDLTVLKTADLIVTMTSAPRPIVLPEHLGPRVRGILDVATPNDVCPSVATHWPSIELIKGGRVRIPGYEGIIGAAIPIPNGQTLACLAETIVLGLRGVKEHFSYGELQTEKVRLIERWSREEGFLLAESFTALVPDGATAPVADSARSLHSSHPPGSGEFSGTL